MRISIAALICATLVPFSAAAKVDSQQQQLLTSGDYRLMIAGSFHRIIIPPLARTRALQYDVWRVTPRGDVEHLYYALIAPTSPPTESDRYLVRSDGRACGFVSLHVYREKGKTFPWILILGYDGIGIPLGSSGRPFTRSEVAGDHETIEKVQSDAAKPNFYSRLSQSEKEYLGRGVPECR